MRVRRESVRSIDERNKLITDNTGLVYALVLKFMLPTHQDFDDVVGMGMLGLLRAAELFDPGHDSEACFSTYATYAIRSYLFRDVRMQRYKGRSVVSVERLCFDAEVPDTLDVVADVEASEVVSVVRAAVDSLPERDASVLRDRLAGVATMDIAKRLSLSRQAVLDIAKRSMQKIKPKLECVKP